jgi:hypothetical protein
MEDKELPTQGPGESGGLRQSGPRGRSSVERDDDPRPDPAGRGG